jgi:hypothetical protein
MIYPYLIEKKSESNDSQRISFFEYMVVFVLIIYAGRANTFVESVSFKDNPVGVFIPILLSGILAIKWRVKFDYRFYLLIFGLAIYFLAISIKYSVIQPTFFLVYLFLFFIVYTMIKTLKFNLFRIYEQILYYLAIIGLFFWCTQIVLRGDTLFFILDKIPGMELFSYVSGNGLNAIIYSIQPSYTSLLYNFTIPRNCGYAWEPGAFAVYLCLAIFINLFFTNPDNKGKIRFWILVTALLSTQSTTGYMIFMLIILFYFLNKQLNIIILLLPMVIISVIYLSTLPFMSNKIIELITETTRSNYLVAQSIGRDEAYTPQRFTSFMIALKDFRNNPVLGLGAHYEESWTYKIGANISYISGIGNLLVQFGIIGFLFFISATIKSSYYFSKYYKYKGKFLLFLIIFLISISYSIILIPVTMGFWMFSIFEPLRVSSE